jgi:hypothetical protein
MEYAVRIKVANLSPVSDVGMRFDRVCADVHKAWTQTQMFVLVSRELLHDVQTICMDGDERALAALIQRATPPSHVQASAQSASGSSTQLELATLVLKQVIAISVASRATGQSLDFDAALLMLRNWVCLGQLGVDGLANQSALQAADAMGGLIGVGAQGAEARLAIMASYIPVMQGFAVASRIPAGLRPQEAAKPTHSPSPGGGRG